jgi:hypothetical protein
MPSQPEAAPSRVAGSLAAAGACQSRPEHGHGASGPPAGREWARPGDRDFPSPTRIILVGVTGSASPAEQGHGHGHRRVAGGPSRSDRASGSAA